jgi:hypothetical protein
MWYCRVSLVTRQITCDFWIWHSIYWTSPGRVTINYNTFNLTVTIRMRNSTPKLCVTTLHKLPFPPCISSLIVRCLAVSLILSVPVSHPLNRVLRRLNREHLIEPFNFLFSDTTAASLFVTAGTQLHVRGNDLLCTRCHVNVFNCHPDNDTGNVVTEPLSSNGRPLWFRYSDF